MDTPNLDAFLKQHNDNTKGLGREVEKMDVVAFIRKAAHENGSQLLVEVADAITRNQHRTVRA